MNLAPIDPECGRLVEWNKESRLHHKDVCVVNQKKEMAWKVLLGAFLLLGAQLKVAKAAEEGLLKVVQVIHEARVPPQALSYLATYNDSSSEDQQTKVSLPSMRCDEDSDCHEYGDDKVCSEGQCSCAPPHCWVYQYEVTGAFTAKNVFTCGECGILGSSCNATIECDYPGECFKDGYCHCEKGENYDGVCFTSSFGWSSTLALAAMGFVLVFAFCIIAVNCFRHPPWRNPDTWCYRCCYDGGGANGSRRRGSCEKSPAFTIQAHYASQDLNVRQDNLEEVVSGGEGGAVPRRHRSRSSQHSGTASSVSSALTNSTNVSDATSRGSTDRATPSPPPSPPPPPPTPPTPPPPPPKNCLNSDEEANRDYGRDISGIQLQDIPQEASVSAPSTSSESTESTSASASGSCSHERCQLCLPKSPGSGPTNATRKPRSNRTDQPLLSLLGGPHAEEAVQLTQL